MEFFFKPKNGLLKRKRIRENRQKFDIKVKIGDRELNLEKEGLFS